VDVAGKRTRRGRLVWVVLGGLAVILGSSAAFAQEQESRLGGKLRSGGEVVVPPDETVSGDLYASGGQVRIDGTVEGDLIAAGGQVQVSGEVGGDMLVGSGNVDISGQVGGDARLGAGQVTVSGSIGEDLVAGSGQATITGSGQVGEDFIFGTGQTSIDGEVVGNVLGSTGSYSRAGTVGGTEDVTIAREKERTVGDRILDAVQRFIAILVIGALLLWLAPRFIEGAADTLRRRPWASLGVGLLGCVGFLVLCILIFLAMILLAIGLGLIRLDDLVGVTIFGGTTALTGVVFVFFLAIAFVAQAVVGLTIGRVMIGISPVRRWLALVLGVLVVVVLSSIPVVGGWLGAIIALFGLGALILEYWPWRRRAPAPAPMGARA
jgi:cytoskeletal protein CcmA (bactofilin family)